MTLANETPPSGPPGLSDGAGIEDIVGRAPMHRRDRVPGFILRLQEWLLEHLEHDRRRTLAIIVALVALFVATAVAGARILLQVASALDLVAYFGLFLVNWLGNGGGLVPIPGARYIGLLMIFQQAVLLPSLEVWAVGGVAMALGLCSYFVAGARTASYYAGGDPGRALETARDATSLPAGGSRRDRLARRVSRSWSSAREKAQPLIEERGVMGMFWICLVPWPLATAGAFLGGAMGFGFGRFLVTSFAAKLALSAIVVLAGVVLTELARRVVAP